jgi:hypothetical protein
MGNGYDDGKIIAHLRAEVERLTADRAALLGLWVIRNGGVWQVRSEAVPPPSYATREEAEEAVLKWAHLRKGGT